MKTLIKMALGFLLLVSAAAATGDSNSVVATAYEEAIGNCITGDASMAQVTEAASFVLGSNNNIDQDLYFTANGNSLTDSGAMDADDEDFDTGFAQVGQMVANATGCYNGVDQDIILDAACDKLTDSSLSQWAVQGADAVGDSNRLFQKTQAFALNDCLTSFSTLQQVSAFDICAVGSSNYVDQFLNQQASDNCLTVSDLSQYAEKIVNILGDDNSVYQNCNFETADKNCLTAGSALSQVLRENAQITGCDNTAIQKSKIDAFCNTLTTGDLLQAINEKAVMAGSKNSITQDVWLYTKGNSITGGKLSQISTIVSND